MPSFFLRQISTRAIAKSPMMISAAGAFAYHNSECFVTPAIARLPMMAAYDVRVINAKNRKWVGRWHWVLPMLIFGWASTQFINYGWL